MNLHGAWLGHWEPPWEFGRGRRWGDTAWALAALSQAYLLGGAERRWPVLEWVARKATGPRPTGLPKGAEPRPRPEWVALLRHGSPATDPARRARHESELAASCWEALLEGDGTPWMAAGTALLDRGSLLRWVALLGAVDPAGRLHLPPFLELQVPPPLRVLPGGWWPRLLSGMDASGRLLPEGSPPVGLPWEDLQPHLQPLLLEDLPAALVPHRAAPWLHEIPGMGWMLDPALRAWGRGWGAAPAALRSLQPPALALGDGGDAGLASILKGRLPAAALVPPGWLPWIEDELQGRRRTEPPQASGQPSWDRLRVRWGGAFPGSGPACPAADEAPHPCADPFHWMAAGQRAFLDHEPGRALRAFTLAHAHFTRLEAAVWARRAAANAAHSALFAAELKSLPCWVKAQGTQDSPFRELDAANLALAEGRWEEADALLWGLTASHPDFPYAWSALAERGMVEGRRAWVEQARPRVAVEPLASLIQAWLDGMPDPAPPGLDPETRLIWSFHRLRERDTDASDLWEAWRDCPNRLLRLGLGLRLLEDRPGQRTPERLLRLQALADRTGLAHYQDRLRALWPEPAPGPRRAPQDLVRNWLAGRARPAWVRCGRQPAFEAGTPELPPEALRSRLRQDGALGPLELDGRLWWGFPLLWEGAPVGAALIELAAGEPLQAPLELELLAPWLAALAPPPVDLPEPLEGELLTDGSEPMGALLRELARVAPTALPLLLLGATGSGKELLAREVHRRSGRSGAFVAVNCSAFAEGVLESELFGHVKGAFTGADRERRGAVESADGGTLLLDEVADLSPRLQSLFLRVLQEQEVRRVGSDRAHKVDVRFLAATHKPLEALVEAGGFRRDLWYRLQGTVLRLPSLRERRHELPWLLPRGAALLARRLKREAPALAPGLAQALGVLPWPGNFREFRHAVERALLRCGEGPLGPSHFPELEAPAAQERSWFEATHAFQRRLLLETLRQHRFKGAEAARTLGLARPALYTAARRLGLDLAREKERWEAEGGTQD